MIQAPEAFKKYPQFILHDKKKPVNYQTLQVHDPHDPAAWMDYATAASLAAMYGLGLGFVFTKADPFWFLDIDGCWDGKVWSQTALSLCQAFTGCAVEVSQSGRGLHVFGSGDLPAHGTRNSVLGLELYSSMRFVALTGNGLTGDAGYHPRPDLLVWLTSNYFPATAQATDTPAEWTDGPCPEWAGPSDDRELIAKMLKSKSATAILGGSATISALWEADESVLSSMFPSASGDVFDHSSVDSALVSHLAFWTGKDCERIDRLFRQSGLMREKWEAREDYRRRTILRAVSICKNVYGGRKQEATEADPVTGGRVGFQFLSVQQQREHFKGCVYIRDLHRVLTADGALLKTEQFRAMYGGYVFAMDAMNEKTTRNAWEAFTESRGTTFPRVFSACFRPELPPGAVVNEEGSSLVNIYVPAAVERKAGDVTPFLNHLHKLLPDPRDHEILLAYMAACVQHIGVKFQWAPLVQGVEGNGKTLLATCLAYAVGWKYVHFPNANDLTNKFNSWLLGKCLIVIEEIYANDRKEAVECLKPMITNPKIEVQGKGQNQIVADNRANFFMCSNHKNALRKTRNDRRYCILFTAQQHSADLHGCGMGGDYFPALYAWLDREGYAAVAHYLHTYPIPVEFNPARGCHRAPETSSTNEAILESLGGIEQEVMEAVQEEKYGFCGGWVSSAMFAKLISERKKIVPPILRRSILEGLGYVMHPGLINGRLNNAILREGGKPRLYIQTHHQAAKLQGSSAVKKAYLDAQEGAS